MAYKRISPIPVIEGGTGIQSATAYAPICGGTTTTGAFQSASTGFSNSGYVFTSNGSSALPDWQATSGGSGSWVLVSEQDASASSLIAFTSIGSYTNYILLLNKIGINTNTAQLQIQVSDDNGSSYVTTGYETGMIWTAYNSATQNNVNSASAFVITGPATNGADYGSGEILLSDVNGGTNVPVLVSGTVSYLNTTMASARMGGRSSASAGSITAFKVFPSSGNFDGNLRLYGIAN